MKIITRGEIPLPPAERKYIFTCGHCSTMFECQGKEGITTDNVITIACPLCGHECCQYAISVVDLLKKVSQVEYTT